MKGDKNPDNPSGIEERLVRLETVVAHHQKAIDKLTEKMNKLENDISHVREALTRHSVYFKILGAIGSATLAGIVSLILMLLFH